MGFKSTKTKYGKIGSLICWDQWFQSCQTNNVKEQKFYLSNCDWLAPKEKKQFGKSQLESWITIQRSHAIANGVFVAAINRIGLENWKKKNTLLGQLNDYRSSGNIIAKSGSDKEVLILALI